MSPEEKEKKESVKTLLNFYAPYHAHKENMAYAGMLLLFGIFSAVIKLEFDAVSNLPERPCIIAIIAVLWLIIHMFIGWQLINRRTAAKIINATVKYLWGKSSIGEPQENKGCDFCKYIKRFIASIFWPYQFTDSVVKIEKPEELKGIIEQTEAGTCIEEWIFFFLSWGMLGALICVICYK